MFDGIFRMVQQVATSCKLVEALVHPSMRRIFCRIEQVAELDDPSMDTCCCIIIIFDRDWPKNFSQWLKAPPNIVECLQVARKLNSNLQKVKGRWKVNKKRCRAMMDDVAGMCAGNFCRCWVLRLDCWFWDWSRIRLDLKCLTIIDVRNYKHFDCAKIWIKAILCRVSSGEHHLVNTLCIIIKVPFCVARHNFCFSPAMAQFRSELVWRTVGDDAKESFLWFPLLSA